MLATNEVLALTRDHLEHARALLTASGYPPDPGAPPPGLAAAEALYGLAEDARRSGDPRAARRFCQLAVEVAGLALAAHLRACEP